MISPHITTFARLQCSAPPLPKNPEVSIKLLQELNVVMGLGSPLG